MYIKNGITYADAGSYLKADNIMAFQLESNSGIKEVKIKTPLDVTIIGDIILFDGIAILAEKLTKKAIKLHIIQMRYSNDDQIAIILNKDDSDDDKLAFERMQNWRKFADDVALAVIK